MHAKLTTVVAVLVSVILAVVHLHARDASARVEAVDPTATPVTLRWWTTTADMTAPLQERPATTFGRDRQVVGAISIGDQPRQRLRGVGAALTESAAVLLGRLTPAARAEALRLVFDPVSGAGVSVVRIPLGASDFALDDYNYADRAPDSTDEQLTAFSIEREHAHVLPVLAEAQALNPALQVVLSPWSAPAWMKTSGSMRGGRLDPAHERVYADYLVRAVAEFRAAGAPVVTLSLANEPGHESPDHPSMLMDVAQQARVAAAVRHGLDGLGLTGVGVLAHDHNWDDPTTPTSLLGGPAGPAFSGAAFHCYAGEVSAQSAVAAAAPHAEIWTTECSGGGWSSSLAQDLRWGARHVLIGGLRHWSTAVLWWNLALDPSGGPTNGGCANCRGVLTVDPTTGRVTPSVEYWLLAHAGRFVPRGSVALSTPERTAAGLESVAFRTPSGGHALLLLNDGHAARKVTVRWNGRSAAIELPAGALATATW